MKRVLAIRRETGDREGIAKALLFLGFIAFEQGDYVQARVLHQQSLLIYRELGNKSGVAWGHYNLGKVAFEQGDYVQAHVLHQQSLTMFRELGNKEDIAKSLNEFALLSVKEAQEARGVRMWGAAASVRDSFGFFMLPFERARQERETAAVRQTLGEAAFAAAWTEGRALTLEQAISYALEEASSE